jgi:hypothetical protein
VKPEPARAPDIKLYPSMVPRSFHVTVRTEGEVLDLTNSDVTAPVYDAIGRYATWRFHEGGVFDYPLIEQRLAEGTRCPR